MRIVQGRGLFLGFLTDYAWIHLRDGIIIVHSCLSHGQNKMLVFIWFWYDFSKRVYIEPFITSIISTSLTENCVCEDRIDGEWWIKKLFWFVVFLFQDRAFFWYLITGVSLRFSTVLTWHQSRWLHWHSAVDTGTSTVAIWRWDDTAGTGQSGQNLACFRASHRCGKAVQTPRDGGRLPLRLKSRFRFRPCTLHTLSFIQSNACFVQLLGWTFSSRSPTAGSAYSTPWGAVALPESLMVGSSWGRGVTESLPAGREWIRKGAAITGPGLILQAYAELTTARAWGTTRFAIQAWWKCQLEEV